MKQPDLPVGDDGAQVTGAKPKRRWLFAVKVGVTIAALAWTVSRRPMDELWSAMKRVPPTILMWSIALTLLNLVLAAARWRVLLAAYGAAQPPSVSFLSRAQLVGHFYNNLLPGNVTGDVVRAHATRDAFPKGDLGAYMVVAIERFFGLAGLLTLGAAVLVWHPLPGVAAPWLFAVLAAGAAIAIVALPIAGRRVGRWLPGRIGSRISALPLPARPGLLGLALAMSVCTHAIVALTGHLLLVSVAPSVRLAESMVLIPIATLAVYFPFAVAGIGVLQAAFVFLFGKVGILAPDAAAGAFAFTGAYLVVALIGGAMHLARPLSASQAAR